MNIRKTVRPEVLSVPKGEGRITAMGTTVFEDDGEIPPGMFELGALRAQSIRDTLAFAAALPIALIAFAALWGMLP